MNEQPFRIRPYSKRELAMLYFPSTKNGNSAVKNLHNLMHRNPDLMKELAEARYQSRCRILTPLQIRIIVRYLVSTQFRASPFERALFSALN